MALVLLAHENLGKDKHVESLLFPSLDEGSIPSSSTNEILKPLNFSGFFIYTPLYSPFTPLHLLYLFNPILLMRVKNGPLFYRMGLISISILFYQRATFPNEPKSKLAEFTPIALNARIIVEKATLFFISIALAISFGGVFWVFPVFGIRHPDSN